MGGPHEAGHDGIGENSGPSIAAALTALSQAKRNLVCHTLDSVTPAQAGVSLGVASLKKPGSGPDLVLSHANGVVASAYALREAPCRLHSRKPLPQHDVCWCDQRALQSRCRSQEQAFRWLYRTIWHQHAGLVRAPSEHGRGHPAREANQEMEPPVEISDH